MSRKGAFLSANATVTAHNAIAVVPSPSDIPVTRALYTGAGGDFTVIMADAESTVTFVGVPAGVILPIQVYQITAAPAAALALY